MSKEFAEDEAGTSSLLESSMMEGDDYYEPAEAEHWTESSQLCRICATTNEYLIPIFDGEGLEHQLSMKIEKHLPIQVKQGDKLPQQVCYQCASTLIAWHDLVIGCINADKKLLQLQEESELSKEMESDDNFNDCDSKSDETQDPLEELSQPSTSKSQVPAKKPTVRSRLRSKKSDPELPLKTEVKEADTGEAIERLEEKMYLSPAMKAGMFNKSHISYTSANVVVLKSKKRAAESPLETMRSAPRKASHYSCGSCGRRFTRKLTLLQHMKIHAVARSSCSVCDESFSSVAMLGNHMVQHTGIHPHECHLCKKGFIFRPSLLKHLLQEHDIHNLFLQCDLCPRSCVTHRRLQRHKKTHADHSLCSICGQAFPWQRMFHHVSTVHGHGPKIHACQLCGNKFNSVKKYKAHVTCHVGVKNLICDACGASFLNNKQLSEHSASHAGMVACAQCGHMFKNKSKLQRHMLDAHGWEGCGKSFATHAGYSQHQVKVHSEDGTNACLLCDRIFLSRAGQQRHMLKTHKSVVVQKPPPSCELCHMTFTGTRSLRDHLRDYHHVTLAFSCKEEGCDKSYSTLQGLRQHEKFFHQRDRTIKYPCEVCGKLLSQAFTRSQHMTIHTGLMNYSCELCHKSFRLQSSLKEHLLTHTDLMPVECPVCSKHFRKKSHLRTHIRTHTGEKPYRCEVCGRAFAQSGDRNKHRINMHN